MNFLEKDLELLIYETSKTSKGVRLLRERGLWSVSKPLIRQYNLAPYGIADLVQFDYSIKWGELLICVDIFELKKEEINENTFLQAIGYCEAIRTFLRRSKFSDCEIAFRVHLIGKKIVTTNNFPYLSSWIYNDDLALFCYEYKFDIEKGFSFLEKRDYHPTALNDSHGNNVAEMVESDLSKIEDSFNRFISSIISEMNLSGDRLAAVWDVFSVAVDARNPHLAQNAKSVFEDIAKQIFSEPEQTINQLRDKLIHNFSNLPF